MKLYPFSTRIQPFWRCVTPYPGIRTHVQKRDWQLVLQSQNIPFQIVRIKRREFIYVPPLLERKAIQEIEAYRRENTRTSQQGYPAAPHKNPWLICLFLLPLLLFHGWRAGWWPAPAFLPPPETWLGLGALERPAIKFHGQWERIFTALTLHASASHISGNLFFGAIFLTLLARATGIGRAFFLTILAGGLGNLASVYAHVGNYRSVGFSTALFAAIGVLCGVMFMRDSRRALMPVAGAAGLLAMLGTEGETTDYAAHIGGLMAGLAFGIFAGYAEKRNWPQIPQSLAGILGIGIVTGAWVLAFQP